MSWIEAHEIELLKRRVLVLEEKLEAVFRAAVAHAGDTEAHPDSNNAALEILRALDSGSAGER